MEEDVAHTLIALACSAGGFPAVREILNGLPGDFPAPILVAQHRGDNSPEAMVRLLSAGTRLRVKTPTPMEKLLGGWVYVCPPGTHIEMATDQVLHTWPGPRINFVRPSCDLLFKSMAGTVGSRGVCVVLSGCGNDGAMATRLVRRLGGFVIAQDEASSSYSAMPTAAVELGRVDLVLPLKSIAFALCQLVQGSGTGEPPAAEPVRMTYLKRRRPRTTFKN